MPLLGRIGKREGAERLVGTTTEDRHVEQTDRNLWRSVEVLRCFAIRSRRSFGSWDHSAIDYQLLFGFPGPGKNDQLLLLQNARTEFMEWNSERERAIEEEDEAHVLEDFRLG